MSLRITSHCDVLKPCPTPVQCRMQMECCRGAKLPIPLMLWNWCRDDQWFPVSFREDLNCEQRHGKRGWRPAWPSIEGVDQRSSHSTAMVGFLYSNSHNVATPFFDIIKQRDHEYATSLHRNLFYVFLATGVSGGCLKVLHIYGKTKALHHCGNYCIPKNNWW